ncbi:MAG: peptide-methionine (S)-S-oxide reductase MsrA [Bacteroidaceae bacterium]|nr:peptide-methionine (S)-S-oxide reductase MsrA [Bacteroidaceae bacterium]
MVDIALQIATKAHEGQTDRDGEAYILHPLTVGLMGRTDEERCAGFLHDVIEDTSVTAQDLLDAGISESVVNALQLLTHDKKTSYDEYVQQIIDSKNPIALRVKFNDLTHNFARGKAYPELQAKHGKALQKIQKAIEDMERTIPYQPTEGTEVAVFAAGCFWGVQHYFERKKGVMRSLVGYTGGKEENPTYEMVRQHKTTHVEAVLVEFDQSIITYRELCKLFFEIHDPAQTDGQGPDKGSQYLSGVFYASKEQEAITNELVDILRQKGHEVNTMIRPLNTFWTAENYHQNYYEHTGGSPYCHVRQKKF